MTNDVQVGRNVRKESKWEKKKKLIIKYRVLYLFALPAVVSYIIFNYIPMYGITLAFQDYVPRLGLLGSPYVGLKHFKLFFTSATSVRTISNTIIISIYSMAAGFISTIFLALLLNEVGNAKYKKVVQTVVYAPNFISLVVMVGMLNIFFSGSGPINHILGFFGAGPQNVLGDSGAFRHLFVWSGVWQGAGYGTVLYLATLAGVDMEQHEAAIIDGASRMQRVWYINIPVIKPVATISLIMSFSGIMSVGFDKMFLMQNNLNLSVSEVISTYIYKVGLINGNMSFSAAVGIMNNVVNCILLLTVNAIARRVSEYALF